MLQDSPMYSYIPARDLERARKFYEGKLGFTPKQEINGGVVYQPQVSGPQGFVPRERWRLPPQTVVGGLTDGFLGAVNEGSAATAFDPDVVVAGKTGTARKPPYDHPPYRYVASFVGFAPFENARLATIVVMDEPARQFFGGTVAAPVFSRIMQHALAVVEMVHGNWSEKVRSAGRE